MASTHIMAVGKISKGSVDIRVALPPKTDSLVLAAISFGRRLYEQGAPKSACVNQHEEAGWEEAEGEAALALMPDGALQDSIDYGAELQELEDDMLDREYWSRGGW